MPTTRKLYDSIFNKILTLSSKAVINMINGLFNMFYDLENSTVSYHWTENVHDNQNSMTTTLADTILVINNSDEINRSSAKTQSAMLEAMQEREVSIGGKTYKLPEVFVVIATQNPIESEGTYVLSEAQLDRFLLKETVTYPSARDEMEILNRVEAGVFSDVKSVASVDDVVYLQKLCKRIYIDPAIKKYIVDIVQATRMTDKILAPELAQYVAMGASTRAAIAFMEVAKAIALINGRRYCVPDDVKALRYSVLRHRIMLTFAAVAEDVKIEKIIDAIIGSVKTP